MRTTSEVPWLFGADHRNHRLYLTADPDRRAEADRFHRDGVVPVRGAVPLDLIEAARAALERSPALRNHDRWQDAWRVVPEVRRLACHPPLLEWLRFLYDREPIPFQTLDFRQGTTQRTHRDDAHFDSVPTGFMCGVWIALEEVGAQQGPVRYYAGSQRTSTADEMAAACDPNGNFSYEQYEEVVAQGLAELHPSDFLAAPGDALIWAAGVAHGGAPLADSTSTRWSQVTHYFFEDCVYITPRRDGSDRTTVVLREPLIDIGTGRAVPHRPNGGPLRVIRVPGGEAVLLDPEEPEPPAVRRLVSAMRGVARRSRHRLALRRADWRH
jgi:hypothetical protein